MQTDTQKCQTDAEKQKAILIWSGSANAPSPIPAKVRAVNRLGMGNGGGTWLTHKDRLASSLRVGGQVALAPLTFTLPRERPALQRHCDEQSNMHINLCTYVSKHEYRYVYISIQHTRMA